MVDLQPKNAENATIIAIVTTAVGQAGAGVKILVLDILTIIILLQRLDQLRTELRLTRRLQT